MIQLGLLETDPNWDNTPQGVTRRFMLAMSIFGLALILLGLPLILYVLALVTPAPLSYRNVPFPICGPDSTISCTPLEVGYTFHPGDIVPTLATRCVDNFFAGDDLFPYHIDRNLTNTVTNVRIILPDIVSAAPPGCMTSVSLNNQLPLATPPGLYYLEGVSTAYGRFRTVNVYWRTQNFQVSKPELGDTQ